MKKQTEFDESVIAKLKNVYKDNSSYITRDRNDLDSYRSVKSGFGFDEKDREYRGNKPEITIPVLNPWLNQVVSAYTSNPFGIGIKSNSPLIDVFRYVFDKVQKDINDHASKMLVEQLGVGYGFLLVSNEIVDSMLNLQMPKISVVDARKVILGPCDDPELDDCDFAAIIDVIDKSKAKERYGLDEYDLKGGKDVLYGFDVIIDTRNQCSVVTTFERVAEGVRTTKIVYDKIVAQSTVNATRIPLVRFYGDECYIEKELHFRGVYQLMCDMWKLVNYGASEIQARIATAPTANFMGDPSAIAEDSEAYETGSERNFLPSKTWNGEKELQPVRQLEKSLNIAELQNSVDGFMTTIFNLLGSVTAEGRGNETAEAVLARKSMAEATVNKYLNNLKKSLKSLGKVIEEQIKVCFDVPRIMDGIAIPALFDIGEIEVSIDDGPIQAGQRQKNLQQVLAFYSMAKESMGPQAFAAIGPAILQMSDMPIEIKQELAKIFANNQQLPPEIQQAMQQKDAQLQQAGQQIQEMQKQLASLQQALFEMQQDSKAMLLKTQMEIESKERIEYAKLQAQGMNIDKELMNKSQMQTDKLMVDYQTAMRKAEIEASKIDMPLFTASKFTA